MNAEIVRVFGVLGLAAVLIASGRVRLDVVALLVVLSLALGGALTVPEALAGFGDPVVVLVAAPSWSARCSPGRVSPTASATGWRHTEVAARSG